MPVECHTAHCTSLKVKRAAIAMFENYAVMQGLAEPRKMAEILYLLLKGA